MNQTSTRWNRTAARLAIAGLAVAITGGAVISAQAAPRDGMHPMGGPMMMMGGPMGPGPGASGPVGGGPRGGGMFAFLSERALDAVGATAEQKAQIRTIMSNARTELQPQRDQERALHDQMRTLFTQPTVDARAAEVLRAQMHAARDVSSRRMLQAMLDVSRVLSPEQRARLAELMAQRRTMMERRGQPG